MRWDCAWASGFLSSCGGKASRSTVCRTRVGLVRVSASGRLSHQCQHQWGWASCVMVLARQGGSMPWVSGKLAVFVMSFLPHLEKVWCSWFSWAMSQSVPSESVKDGPCFSPFHPSLLPLPSARSFGKDWSGGKEQPHAQPGFSGVYPVHHYSQRAPVGWHAGREGTAMCL